MNIRLSKQAATFYASIDGRLMAFAALNINDAVSEIHSVAVVRLACSSMLLRDVKAISRTSQCAKRLLKSENTEGKQDL